jgi:hypothetical protein
LAAMEMMTDEWRLSGVQPKGLPVPNIPKVPDPELEAEE